MMTKEEFLNMVYAEIDRLKQEQKNADEMVKYYEEILKSNPDSEEYMVELDKAKYSQQLINEMIRQLNNHLSYPAFARIESMSELEIDEWLDNMIEQQKKDFNDRMENVRIHESNFTMPSGLPYSPEEIERHIEDTKSIIEPLYLKEIAIIEEMKGKSLQEKKQFIQSKIGAKQSRRYESDLSIEDSTLAQKIAHLYNNYVSERAFYESHKFNIEIPYQLETMGLTKIGNCAYHYFFIGRDYFGKNVNVQDLFSNDHDTFSEDDERAHLERPVEYPIRGIESFQAFDSAVAKYKTLVFETESDLKTYIDANKTKFSNIIELKSSGDTIGYYEQLLGQDNKTIKEIKAILSEKKDLEKKLFKSDEDRNKISTLESEISSRIPFLSGYSNNFFQTIYSMFNKIGIKTKYVTDWYKFDLDFSSEENLEKSIQNLYSMFEKLKEIIKKIEIQIQQEKDATNMDSILSDMIKHESELRELQFGEDVLQNGIRYRGTDYSKEYDYLESLASSTATAKTNEFLDSVKAEAQNQSDMRESELRAVSLEELRRMKEQIVASTIQSDEDQFSSGSNGMKM